MKVVLPPDLENFEKDVLEYLLGYSNIDYVGYFDYHKELQHEEIVKRKNHTERHKNIKYFKQFVVKEIKHI
jgi:hypothetical protein